MLGQWNDAIRKLYGPAPKEKEMDQYQIDLAIAEDLAERERKKAKKRKKRRREEVDRTWDHWGCTKTAAEICGLALEQSQALADEVDARDRIITELLVMLKPGEPPKMENYPPSGFMFASNNHSRMQALYARACEIAGRTE